MEGQLTGRENQFDCKYVLCWPLYFFVGIRHAVGNYIEQSRNRFWRGAV